MTAGPIPTNGLRRGDLPGKRSRDEGHGFCNDKQPGIAAKHADVATKTEQTWITRGGPLNGANVIVAQSAKVRDLRHTHPSIAPHRAKDATHCFPASASIQVDRSELRREGWIDGRRVHLSRVAAEAEDEGICQCPDAHSDGARECCD